MWGILIALLAAWVIVLPESIAPFQGGKAIVLILGAGWALAYPGLVNRRPRTIAEALPLLALLTIALSTVLSPARQTALGGNDFREMGALVWGGAIVMTWSCSRVRAGSFPLAQTLLAGSGLAVGTLLWARALPPRGALAPLAPAFQAGGTLGNAAFLATALVPLVPYFLGMARATTPDKRWRPLWWAAIAWCGVGIVLSGSRAGLLGLLVAALGLGILWLPRPWRWVWAGMVGVPPTAILVWAATHPYTWAWDFLHRNATLVQRLIVWQATLTLLARHPLRAIVGFGPDTMALFFPEVYPPVLIGYEPDVQPHVFDRAHTLVLDVWLSFGIVGLLLMGGALVVWARAWWRARGTPGDAYRDGAFVATWALLSTWLLHFPIPPTLLMAGLLAVEAVRPAPVTPRAREAMVLPRLWGMGLGLVAVFALVDGAGRALLGGLALVGAGLSLPFGWGSAFLEPLLVPAIGVGAALLAVAEVPGGASLVVLLFLMTAWAWYERHHISRRWWPVLAVLALVVPPLLGDAWLGAGERALAQGEVKEALVWGERAWRILPREHAALFNVRAIFAREDEDMAQRVRASLSWLDRSPLPHSANWWHVRLELIRRAVEEGVVDEKEWRRALEGARAYFPGNLLWR